MGGIHLEGAQLANRATLFIDKKPIFSFNFCKYNMYYERDLKWKLTFS